MLSIISGGIGSTGRDMSYGVLSLIILSGSYVSMIEAMRSIIKICFVE